jgi:hypothetical protein
MKYMPAFNEFIDMGKEREESIFGMRQKSNYLVGS